MKEDKSDILSKIGRKSGFKVPENYFEDFASKMEQVIPQHQVIPEVKPTLWNRLRPYVYLAAMFAEKIREERGIEEKRERAKQAHMDPKPHLCVHYGIGDLISSSSST